MQEKLPYLGSYKNVGVLFERVQQAAIPEAFSTRFLANTLGLKGSADRNLIGFLKTLGFLGSSGKPTNSYALLKNKSKAGYAIAEATRMAYAPLYAAHENAHLLNQDELRDVIAQVSGAGADTVSKMSGTFRGLLAVANFAEVEDGESRNDSPPSDSEGGGGMPPDVEEVRTNSPLRPEFHYNIQIHLPSNASEEAYMNIFNALRKVFK